jgi:hypothetical protein
MPRQELVSQLRIALNDQTWTVRWNAVTALASLQAEEALAQVLQRSRPRDHSTDRYYDFDRAVSSIERLGRAG